MRETMLFDPDSIQTELQRDLSTGLRMLAAALDANLLTGGRVDVQGVGGRENDELASVYIRIVVSAPLVMTRAAHQELDA